MSPATRRRAPAKKEKFDPDTLKPWIRIVRDLVLVVIAVFILVHQTAFSDSPNITLVTAAMGCLGLPTALRLTKQEG